MGTPEKHFAGVRGVVFDAFGTLVHIGQPRRPYRQLLQIAAAAARTPRSEVARAVMTRDLDLAGVTEWLGLDLSPSQFSELKVDLDFELDTITLFPDVCSVLEALHARGVKVGLCSNLATPYAAPIQALLPGAFDSCVWSFEVGALKPEPAIFQAVCRTLELPPAAILFVGDTYEADVAGPRAFGMKALHLARDGESADAEHLTSLDGLLPYIL